MKSKQNYIESIKNVLDSIQNTIVNHNIQPDDLLDIWAAGLACTSSLCPEKLGTIQPKTIAEMDAMGATTLQEAP